MAGLVVIVATHVALHAEDVRPPVVVVADVALGIKELINELGALAGFCGIQEFPGLFLGRNAPDDVEIRTADKSLVGGWLVRFDLVGLIAFFDEGINALADLVSANRRSGG